MVAPIPRRTPGKSNNPDYDLVSPLPNDTPHLCKSNIQENTVASYSDGSYIETKIEGGARHDGGQCQFSLSNDGLNFVNLQTVYEDCPRTDKIYKPMIPKNIKPGKYIYAWSWINKVGNPEFYMNCADILITGNGNKDLEGKAIVVANIKIGKGPVTGPEALEQFKILEKNQPIIKLNNVLQQDMLLASIISASRRVRRLLSSIH